MDAVALRQSIIAAFACVPRPSRDDIAPHNCLECDELANDLSEFDATNIPDNIILKHVWDIPLLSAEAKHYYLPAWLLRGIDLDTPWLPDQCDAVLLAIESFDHRWNPTPPYTKDQWKVLLAWIKHIEKISDEVDSENIKNALLRVSNEL